jgi:nitrate reductase (NAD(P)H)
MSTTVTQVRTAKVPSKQSTLKHTQIKIEEQEVSPLDTPDIPLPPPSKNLSEVLSIDKATPDGHVARDPRLIRLTGVHPFNVEAPLTPLFQEGRLHSTQNNSRIRIASSSHHTGFLTSPELFYVRNHGPVPHVRDEEIPTWEISIEGSDSDHIL